MTSLVFGEAATAAKGTTPYYTKSPIPPAKNVGCNQRFYIENVPELPLLPGATDHKRFIPSQHCIGRWSFDRCGAWV